MNQKILFIILLLVGVGLGAWYFDRNFINSEKKSSNNKTSEENVPRGGVEELKIDLKSTEDKLIAVQKSGSKTEIIQTDYLGKNKKVLFTDADEELKIKKIGGLASVSNEILAYVYGNSGKLELIKADGSGKKQVIIETFPKPNALAISPDGKTIAYVSFSNIEEDYGYNLFTVSRDGSSKRKLLNEEQEIKAISWNKDGTKIVFVKINNNKSEVAVTDIGIGQAKTLYATDDAITSLKWNQNGAISVTQSEVGKLSSSKIIAFGEDGKEKIIATFKDGSVFNACLSTDNSLVAYLKANIKVLQEDITGSIFVSNADGTSPVNIFDGVTIIGWQS